MAGFILTDPAGLPVFTEATAPLSVLFTDDTVISLVQAPVVQPFPYPGVGNTVSATITGVTAGNTVLVVTTSYPFLNGIPTFHASDSVAGLLTSILQELGPSNGNQWTLLDFSVISNAAAGSHTVTGTFNTNPAADNVSGYMTLIELNGVASVSPLDTSAKANGNVGTPTTGASGAPTSTNDMAVAAFSFISVVAQTIVEPTGWVNLMNQPGGSSQVVTASVDMLSAPAAAQNVTWGTFSGSQWSAGVVLLKPTVAAPPLTLTAAMVPFALTLLPTNVYLTGAFTLYAAPLTFDLTLAYSQDAFQLDAAMLPFALTVNPAGLAIGGTIFTNPFDWSDGLDIYDFQNGSLLVAWGPYGPTVPDSYNIYVAIVPETVQPTSGILQGAQNVAPLQAAPITPLNWTLNQNVFGQLAIVSGLQHASYNASTGIVTPSLTYNIKVVPVVHGAEVGIEIDRNVTPQPSSVELLTPMKRLWPFPNTGLN